MLNLQFLFQHLRIGSVGKRGLRSHCAFFDQQLKTVIHRMHGVKMNMGFTTTVPDEEIDEKGKHVSIKNEGDYDCFVRVKAFAPVALTYLAPDGGWQAGDDGYWYYESVLPAGETTKQKLNISYQFPSGDGKASEFNVVVIQECTPVLFDANGNAYADWNHAVTADSGDTQE